MKHYALSISYCALCALVLCTLTTSCKDDDDDNKGNETPENVTGDPFDTDEAQTAWRWLCALTDVKTLDNDWAKKTYEPTVGVVSEQNTQTRIVVVKDLSEAKTKFSNLADVATSKLGSEVTVSQEGVGRLTWTPSPQGAQNLAEVAVDTKLIPHLSKIVYCTEQQTGLNGLFSSDVKGTAYYRFGDVVYEKKTNKYWVCVRPSFEQHDKGDSHWIHIFNSEVGASDLPEENLYQEYNNVKKYDNNTIILPTKLKYNREHMNNLSNLIWALLYRESYARKVGVFKYENGLGGFDYQAHGMNFLKNVSDFWSKSQSNGFTVWWTLFNRTREQMLQMNEMTFIYKGYQWRVGKTGYVWEYTTKKSDVFLSEAPGSESDDKKLYNFGGEGYDVRRYTSHPNADNTITDSPNQFENGHYYWVVEYKKGSELMGEGKYSPYEKLVDCEDYYRYNQLTNQDTHLDVVVDNEVVVQNPVNNRTKEQNLDEFYGRGMYCLGDVYQDENGHKWFVTNMAGRDDYDPLREGESVFDYLEPKPFAELVSFEGLTVSDNGKYITNLPSHDQAIRGMIWVWSMFSRVENKSEKDMKNTPIGESVLNIINHANVDVRKLFQWVEAEDHNPRNCSQHACVAYRIPGLSSGQPLFRYLRPIELDNQASPFHFHDHYVSNPDSVTKSYTSNRFSDNIIFLQDVANAEKVKQYAIDFFARQPLNAESGGDGQTPRKDRRVDERANTLSNFFYNRQTFNNFSYITNMWNAPVLMFRVTRVYDRGKAEYSTNTMDGHQLTLVSRQDMFEPNDPDCPTYQVVYGTNNGTLQNLTGSANLLDGKQFTYPSWKTAWP